MLKKIMCLSLIALMLFSCLAAVNAGTKNVIVEDGKIHIDADNGQTAFRWGYKITFDNGGVIQVGYPHGDKTCTHDEYYNIQGKMNVTIVDQCPGEEFHDVFIKNIDARACGFKIYGTCYTPHINYNFWKNGVHYTGQLKWSEFNKKFKGD